MAEDPNLPTGVPPKPAEAAKVQPKKETVRINLPPKPTASATIKLPTLPPGGPPVAKPAAPPVAAAAAAPVSAAPPASAPKAAPPKPPVAGAPASRVATSAPTVQRPTPSAAAPAPAAPGPAKRTVAPLAGISGVDKGLAIAAAVASVAAPGSVVYLGWFLTNVPAS